MIKVSIIVPLHNSEKYLQECMDSIVGQTLKDIEVICIDSSTDHTLDIMEEYQKNDTRIYVIQDENSSYGHKINVGIQQAKGKYIGIVESDDYIAANMMETLFKAAETTHADIVKADYEGFIDVDGIRKTCKYHRGGERFYGRIIDLNEEPDKMPAVGYNIWAGIYKTAFIKRNNLFFHESAAASYQDTGFACLSTMKARTIFFLDDCFYKYRMDNEGSSVKSDKKYQMITSEFKWIYDRMEEMECTGEREKTYYSIKKLESYYWNYNRLSEAYRKKFIEEIADEKLSDFDETMIGFSMAVKEKWLGLLNGDPNVTANFEREDVERGNSYSTLYKTIRKSNSIVIVGAGNCAKFVLRMMEMANYKGSLAICDNNKEKQNTVMEGNTICSVEEAASHFSDAQYIIANKRRHDELKYQILELGVPVENILISDRLDDGVAFFESFIKYCK